MLNTIIRYKNIFVKCVAVYLTYFYALNPMCFIYESPAEPSVPDQPPKTFYPLIRINWAESQVNTDNKDHWWNDFVKSDAILPFYDQRSHVELLICLTVYLFRQYSQSIIFCHRKFGWIYTLGLITKILLICAIFCLPSFLLAPYLNIITHTYFTWWMRSNISV